MKKTLTILALSTALLTACQAAPDYLHGEEETVKQLNEQYGGREIRFHYEGPDPTFVPPPSE